MYVFTEQGFGKETDIGEYEIQGRNGKGLKTFFWTKSGANGTRLISAFYVNPPAAFRLRTRTGQTYDVVSADIPADARYGKGSQLVPAMLGEIQ